MKIDSKFIIGGLLWMSAHLLWTPLYAEELQPVSVNGSYPAFWEVSSAYNPDTKLYLLGSVHLGKPDFYPFPQEIETGFNNSDVLLVEMDITAIDPHRAAQTMSGYAMYTPGQSLKGSLSSQLWKELETVSSSVGLPLDLVDHMKPWFVAMQLELLLFQQRGFSELYGVDLHFLNKKAGKRVISIETLEEQLDIFSQLDDREQSYFLGASLKGMDQIDHYIARLTAAWREGKEDELQALMLKHIDLKHPTGLKLHDLLFTRRNHLMVQAAEKQLRSGRNGFMVVGAAHLLGDEGIVQLLAQREHRVERVIFSR